jgi:hypothetical protein
MIMIMTMTMMITIMLIIITNQMKMKKIMIFKYNIIQRLITITTIIMTIVEITFKMIVNLKVIKIILQVPITQ